MNPAADPSRRVFRRDAKEGSLLVSARQQLAFATVVIFIIYWAAVNFQPLLLLAIPVTLLGLEAAITSPFYVCLLLSWFAYFKFDNAFPVLAGAKFILFFSVLTMFGLLWHLVLSRSTKPYWSLSLKVLFAFFMIVTISVPFAA